MVGANFMKARSGLFLKEIILLCYDSIVINKVLSVPMEDLIK